MLKTKTQMILDIEDIQHKIASLKLQFYSYISDTTLPLTERWEFFLTAPSYLKEHKGWVEEFKVLEDENLEYYSDLGYERYTTVDTDGLVDRVMDCIDEEKFPSEKLAALQEEILLKNMGSFTYDW